MNIPIFYKGLLVLLLLGTSRLSGAAPLPTSAPIPTFQGVLSRQWNWIDQKWTNDDKSYLQAREKIAALWRTKKMSLKELKRYKQLSQVRPADSVALFRWAYYAYCFSLLQTNRASVSGQIGNVSKTFSARSTPNSYQYARLRFLIACSPGGSAGFPYGNGPYLKQLGERLLQRNPKDEGVKTCQIKNLMTGKPQDEKKALRYAQDLVKAHPQDASAHITLGFIYQRWTWDEKSRFSPRQTAAQQAINAYQKALALNKSPGKWRVDAQNNIRKLQKI